MTFDDWFWQKLVDPEFRIQYGNVEDLLREAWHESWRTTSLRAELRENALTARLAAAEAETETARTAARYLADAMLHGGDGRHYMQALAFWPWLNCSISSKSSGGEA